ncbi:hypothetical protein BHM03_00052533 [Ensete ventricosum]|nr:hypothetical protein BHM03_00052533 [Ensete ventricosum]
MGQVTYEYGYRVALARFRALHPDSEVEEDPFTIHPEDDLVSMKRQQAFDDSDPPESGGSHCSSRWRVGRERGRKPGQGVCL